MTVQECPPPVDTVDDALTDPFGEEPVDLVLRAYADGPDDEQGTTVPQQLQGEETAKFLVGTQYGAFCERLVQRYGNSLGITGDDLVMEVARKLARSRPNILHGLDPIPRSYLYTVAHRAIIDRWRYTHSSIQPPTVSLDAALTVDPSIGEPKRHEVDPGTSDERLETVETRTVLERVLAGLSSEHREVLLTRVAAGNSCAQTAEILGIPKGTVKSRVFYALRAARTAMSELGIEP